MRHLSWVAVIALLVAACGGVEAAPSTTAVETMTPTSRPTTTNTMVPVTAAVETYQGVDPGTVFSWPYDLSLWVTEDEMTALFQDLSERYGYAWAYRGDLGGTAVLARPGQDFIWSVGFWAVGVHAGHQPLLELTDPRLPDGVTYWGSDSSYGFSGPNSTGRICITVTTPGTINGVEHEGNYMSIVFDIATMMLKEMRWFD